ncbi:MAG: hypothetical protein JNG84_03855 [Archangium sp.]|nr:hypothetical protein [Archangium sp.]
MACIAASCTSGTTASCETSTTPREATLSCIDGCLARREYECDPGCPPRDWAACSNCVIGCALEQASCIQACERKYLTLTSRT